MYLHFTVLSDENNMLLRDFLKKRGVSASLIRSVKTHGGFFANGQEIRTNMTIEHGQNIFFALVSNEETSVIPQDLPIEIVYEDKHAMLLNKSANQAVHPTLGYKDGTLANAFCAEMQRRGTNKIFRPINRLDKNTSGLVLCALNEYSAPLLAKSAKKTYFAIAEGKTPNSGEINLPIGLEDGSYIKRAIVKDGKESKTVYNTVWQNEKLSLLKINLLTGRTHQIRVHFSHLGYPLAGDDLYGGSMQFINRQALACKKMSFFDIEKAYGATIFETFDDCYTINSHEKTAELSEEHVNIEIDLAADMKNLIDSELSDENFNKFVL